MLNTSEANWPRFAIDKKKFERKYPEKNKKKFLKNVNSLDH